MNNSGNLPATISKSERLKSQKTISRLFSINQSILIYPFKIVWEIQHESSKFEYHFGVSVAKRNFKKAVDRNLIKRRMREAFRKNKHILISEIQEYNINLSFMVIYVAKDFVSYGEMESRMKKILVRLKEISLKRTDF